MKKVLLGTTALLAAGMLAGPALGQARTPMTATNFNLTLGGFTQFRVEYQSRSPGQNVTALDADGTLADEPRKTSLDFDAELEFRGAATLSNGIKMGWEIELESGGQELLDFVDDDDVDDIDIIDDNFMYVEGRWGKVTMGGFSVTTLDVGIARTFTGAGAIDLTDDAGETVAAAPGNQASFTNSITVNNGRNRIQYEPPSVAGFRFMLAWAPDLSSENTVRPTQQDDVGQADQDVFAATQWAGAVMGNRVRASFGYATSRPENNDPTAVGVSRNNRWRAGADVEIGPITVGGYYYRGKDNAVAVDSAVAAGTDAGGFNVDEQIKRYGIGATYELGVWEFGVGYERAQQEELNLAYVAPGSGKDTATRMDFGVNYTGLGGGRTIRAGIRTEKWNDDMDNPDKESKTRTIDVRYEWDVGPGLEFDVGYQNYRYTHHVGLDATDTQDQRTAHGVVFQTKLTF
jgi:outer membrane protein OmpU